MKLILQILALVIPRDMRLEYRDEMVGHALQSMREGGIFAAFRAFADFVVIGIAERAAILSRDVSFAVTSARRTPLFAAVVIGTLAIALSAVVTLLAAITAIFFRPLPFDQPTTLVVLWERSRTFGSDKVHLSYPDAEAVRSQTHGFLTLGEYVDRSETLSGKGPARALAGGAVNDDFFRVYSWQPVLGRFIERRDLQPGAAPVVVISHNLWETTYQGASGVIGKIARIGSTSYRIIGVAPRNVFEANSDRGGIARSDFFVPQMSNSYVDAGHMEVVVGRLTPGSTIDHVDSELARIFSELSRAHPDTDADSSSYARSLSDELLGEDRSVALLVVIVAFSILLIACANVTNLFLSRAAARESEIAIRHSVGATRRRIVSQLLTEAALYVFVGTLGGTTIAAVAVHFLGPYMSPYPNAIEVKLDFATLIAAAGVATLVTIGAGLVPALALTNRNTSQALKANGRGANTAPGRRMRAGLAGLEIALALAACIAAALSVRSVDAMAARPLGFDPTDLHLVRVAGITAIAQADVANAKMQRIAKRIVAFPGVLAAEWSTAMPFGGQPDNSFHIVGSNTTAANDPHTNFGFVSNGFFRALRVPLIAGRSFDESDRRTSPAVAIVNVAFAKQFFGSPERALGRRLIDGYGDPVEATIVGVVGDVRNSRSHGFEPGLYLSVSQKMTGHEMLVVRALPGVDVAQIARDAVGSTDLSLVAGLVMPYSALLDNDIAPFRTVADVLTALGIIALALSLAGVYAIVSYGVSQRTHEIGIRVALGARSRTIVFMVLGEIFGIALPSAAIGVMLGLTVASQLGEILIDVPTFDPLIYGAVVSALGIAVFLAAVGPALRASRIVPLVALRYE